MQQVGAPRGDPQGPGRSRGTRAGHGGADAAQRKGFAVDLSRIDSQIWFALGVPNGLIAFTTGSVSVAVTFQNNKKQAFQ
ncbi:hypothetical protein EMIT0P176_110050 [Pseudomonas sp. IT-P176]